MKINERIEMKDKLLGLTTVIAGTAGVIVYIVISLLFAAIPIAGGIWLYNTLTEDKETSSYKVDDTEIKQDYTAPETLTIYERQSYMDTCNPSGQPGSQQSYCQCTLSHLEANNSVQRIRQMEQEITDEYIPPEAWAAIEACAGYIN